MKNKIKIAIVTSAFGDTGGPEVATLNLTNALVKKNINVTLFAPADFNTNAKHVSTLEKSIWKMDDFKDQSRFLRRNYIIASQTKVLSFNDFDLIHLHTQKYAYSIGVNAKCPCILTYHSKITKPEFEQISKGGIYTVAQTKSHRNGNKTTAVIPNGIDTSKISPCFDKGKYLITAGRLNNNKGIDIAIKIAKKSQKKLIIIGRIGISDERKKYYNDKILPFLNKNIIHIEEMPQKELFEYIKKAEALLIPIRPASGFGIKICPLLVMEALACGTPIIGTPINSMGDQFDKNSIGMLSNNINDLIQSAKNTDKFDRKKCREYAEKYFDSSIMAEKYLKLYQKILQNKKSKFHL